MYFLVAPFAGAWIEICFIISVLEPQNVAPFAGAWIEITYKSVPKISLKSLPSRERGLKYGIGIITIHLSSVAPFAGAWIEIKMFALFFTNIIVAPFAGAWIEIWYLSCILWIATSLPSRERGLKFLQN